VRTFHRYVAIGDSSTEGLVDPDGAGGYRGWADRLAQLIAQSPGRRKTQASTVKSDFPIALSLEQKIVSVPKPSERQTLFP
jgi:hypothetical protein